MKIAFLHDMSVPGSAQIVAPALLGLQLALQEAVDAGDLPVVPEVVGLDVDGRRRDAIELAHEIADDPAYVAAVVGPFWSEPVDVGDVLQTAGVPTISMSELDPSLATHGWSSWWRIVAGVSRRSRRARRGDPRQSPGRSTGYASSATAPVSPRRWASCSARTSGHA